MTTSENTTMLPIRLAELIGALSIATDLAMGQPLEFAISSCLLAVRLAESLGWDESQCREAYYQALLRYIGCNAGTQILAAIFGDEIALRKDFARVDLGRQSEVMRMVFHYIRTANQDASSLQLIQALFRGVLSVPQTVRENFAGHCEVAQRLATRMGFEDNIIRALGQLYERWDGKGMPNGLKGEDIAPAVLLVTLAQDVITFCRLGGLDTATAMVRTRAGQAYAPEMAERFLQDAPRLTAGLDGELVWDAVMAMEPGKQKVLSGTELDTACEAIADFADVKSPYMLGHSRAVAELAASAGLRCGLPDADVKLLRRAGLLHDVGKVAISTSVWVKPGNLSAQEWEQVRLHPYYAERIFARSPGLAKVGKLASLHHERLDGSGYHRGFTGAALPPTARILAAANAYQALLEARSYRPAQPSESAAQQLLQDVRAGRLDGEAVRYVLNAAGEDVRPVSRQMVGDLSARELEVLRLIARGNTIKQIAKLLTLSEKTVDNHIQHIYIKIGVSTRAGATLFATEHYLLDSDSA